MQLDPLAPLLDVADGAALQSDPVAERFLVQAQVEPGAADALAELLVEVSTPASCLKKRKTSTLANVLFARLESLSC